MGKSARKYKPRRGNGPEGMIMKYIFPTFRNLINIEQQYSSK